MKRWCAEVLPDEYLASLLRAIYLGVLTPEEAARRYGAPIPAATVRLKYGGAGTVWGESE